MDIRVCLLFCWLITCKLSRKFTLVFISPVMQISAQESRRKKKEYMETLEKRWDIVSWQASHVFYNLCTPLCSFLHVTCLLLFILDLVLKQTKVISIFFSPMQSRKLCNWEFRTSQKSGYIRNYKSVSCLRKVHLSVITAKAAGPYDDCNVKYALLYGHPGFRRGGSMASSSWNFLGNIISAILKQSLRALISHFLKVVVTW